MKKFVIAQNGKSDYYIVTSQYAHEAERFAASQLQKYMYQSTNVCVPFFSDRCSREGKEILIGANARNINLPMDELTDEGFIIKNLDDDIIIAGKTPRGTLYGVYTFLERFVGFRCFTKDIEKIDCMESLVLDEVNIIENPAFEYREAYFRDAFDGDFCSKKKMNSNMADLSREKGGKLKFYNFHHSFCNLVPVDKYFDTHPEYFSEVNGKREKEKTQLCLSNPNVVRIATEKVRKWISDNPHCYIFSVAQNDCAGYCTCENCRKIDEYEESPAGSIIHFVNQIAENIEKDYADILLHTFAYQYSKKAPKYIKPHKNVIVRLCNIECTWEQSMQEQAMKNPQGEAAGFVKNINEWAKICNHLYIWDYAVNFKNYMQPFVNLYSMAENIKLYKDSNIKGVLQQGNFSYGGGAALDDLKSYLISKLLWNPEFDVDEIIDEFLLGCYGKGAPYIKKYIHFMTNVGKDKKLSIYDDTDADYLTDEIVENADALFLAAEDAAETDIIKRRIEREHLSIKYVKLTKLPLDYPNREQLIEKFYELVKSFGITEIMERRALNASFEIMKKSRFCKNRDNLNRMYYIMQ